MLLDPLKKALTVLSMCSRLYNNRLFLLFCELLQLSMENHCKKILTQIFNEQEKILRAMMYCKGSLPYLLKMFSTNLVLIEFT